MELDAPAHRRAMVARLRADGVTDERVLAAMAAVPRERFVGDALAGEAHDATPLPIAAGQTVSTPYIVATMTAALGLTGRERVLEIGTGSGYAAAVLSRCAGEVVSIEYHEELARGARHVLAATGHRVEVRHGDGRHGAPDRAPFDAISVTAMAEDDVPGALVDQLAPDGVLVCPVGSGRRGRLVRRHRGGSEILMPVAFVPLVGGDGSG